MLIIKIYPTIAWTASAISRMGWMFPITLKMWLQVTIQVLGSQKRAKSISVEEGGVGIVPVGGRPSSFDHGT